MTNQPGPPLKVQVVKDNQDKPNPGSGGGTALNIS